MDYSWMTDTELLLLFWDEEINNWFFLFSFAFLIFEIIRLAVKKELKWDIIWDAVTNYITLLAFFAIGALFFGTYLFVFYFFHENFSLTEIPVTWWSIALCVVLADFVYYWEHRFMHRIGIGWATHTVHHSSPYFNISVAYRFGPLDGIMPLFFHIPLVILGFNPWMVLLAESLVQLYQTALHTEVVKKFPRPIEAIMNTPSHHRVHHGSNEKYIDKNYAGIFIIWDRMFGSFAEEKEKVVYGITRPIESVNPFIVFLHGFGRLAKLMWHQPGFFNKIALIFMPPGWQPKKK